MKNSITMVATAFAAFVGLTQWTTAEATDLKVLSANGMREVIEDLGPKFERATTHKLATIHREAVPENLPHLDGIL